MGLVVHSLSEFPVDARRSYYIYVLYGSWDGEVERALHDNFPGMADKASRSGSAVITGTVGHHFQNEVFSWHHLNGEEAETLLPAVLITTVHPALFRDSEHPYWRDQVVNDKMVLVPLADRGRAGVTEVIRSIFEDIRQGRELKDFTVAKQLRRGPGGAILDGLILQPNFMGVGFDFKKAFGRK